MKFLIALATVLFVNQVYAGAIAEYYNESAELTKKYQDCTVNGSLLSTNELIQKIGTLKSVEPRAPGSCQIYDAEYFAIAKDSGFIVNDNYSGGLLSLRLLVEMGDGPSTELETTNVNFREGIACVQENNGVETVIYNLEIADTTNMTYPDIIQEFFLGSLETTRRQIVLEIKDGYLLSATQLRMSDSDQFLNVVTAPSINIFRCAQPPQ